MRKGFTMIELLVVISIIGILAALAMVSFSGSQKQARDTARKSDLKQYATSLEGYGNKNNGLYPARPVSGGVDASEVLCGDIDLENCPQDPKNGTDPNFFYRYQSNGSGSTGNPSATSYVLWTELENVDSYWVVCSTGKSAAISKTGFGVSGGTCPI